ncbi:MAG: site-2 protease family protein [Chthoniobacteraceae bacterium]
MEKFFAVLKIIGILIEVVLVFNLLIIVHELGHFLAAKWRGLHIEGFGIWFGKPIWQKRIGGVLYSLGCIPAGGFVKLPQLMDSAIEGSGEYAAKDLPKLKPVDKIIVAFAGPLFSFLLAAFFAIIVWQVGRPVSEAERTTTIGYVEPKSAAAKIGLQAGDVILKIDGYDVKRWAGQSDDSVTWRIAGSEDEKIRLEVKRGNEVLQLDAVATVEPTKWYQRRGLRRLGLGPVSHPMVASVGKGSAAEKAGFKANDVLVRVGGEPIYGDHSIGRWAKAHPGEPVVITVERGAKQADGKYLTADIPFEPRGLIVAGVFEGSPAAVAGLKTGDRVLSVDGKPIPFAESFIEYIGKHEGKKVALTIERGTETKELNVVPELPLEIVSEAPGETVEKPNPSIGISIERGDGLVFDQKGRMWPIYPLPGEQLSDAAKQIAETMKKLSPTSNSQISIQHMGGPVMMMRIYYLLFESPEGWRLVLWFSVIINVNLALMNMLPIPPLDGSHITLALVELVRGKPPGARTAKMVEWVQIAGTLLVVGMMLFITLFDVQDLFGGGAKKAQMRFKPRTAIEKPM